MGGHYAHQSDLKMERGDVERRRDGEGKGTEIERERERERDGGGIGREGGKERKRGNIIIREV